MALTSRLSSGFPGITTGPFAALHETFERVHLQAAHFGARVATVAVLGEQRPDLGFEELLACSCRLLRQNRCPAGALVQLRRTRQAALRGRP